MKISKEILDEEILSNFKNIFQAMNIGEYQIITAIQNISLPPLDFETREKLSTDGLLAAENFADEWIEIAEPQLYFKYKKNVVIMYQRDQFLTQANYNQKRYRPFHLCFCQALRDAHEKNRYESRYVMTYNTSGLFKVNLSVRDQRKDNTVYTDKREQGIYLPLKVCQHCLREINWKHFRKYCGSGLDWWRGGDSNMRKKIVDEFDLEEYLISARQNNFFEHPVLGTASSSIKKEYVLSPQFKEELKKITEYTCDICRNQFPAGELQIHHKNHNEGDNRRQNLMVVCKHCHALIHKAEGGFVSFENEILKNPQKFNQATSSAKKYRIFELEKEFNLPSSTIINFLKQLKINVANRFSAVGEDAYKLLQDNFGNNSALTFSNCKAHADRGDIKAKVRLGLIYTKGIGIEKNLNAAKKIVADLREKIEVADSEFLALCMLAENNDNTMKFHAKTVQLWQIAAEHGDKTAQHEVARFHDYNCNVAEEIANDVAEEMANQAETAKNIENFIELAKIGDDYAISQLEKFSNDGNEKVKNALDSLYWYGNKSQAVGTVIIRAGVTAIGEREFQGCGELKEIKLPDGLTTIGESAFWACSELKEIKLPDSLSTISDFTFLSCRSLQEIKFSNSLTSIGYSAFRACVGLKEIKFPDSLVSIGYSAFEGCVGLKEIKFPNSLTSIGEHAFFNCNSLKKIAYYKETEPLLIKCFGSNWDGLEKVVLD